MLGYDWVGGVLMYNYNNDKIEYEKLKNNNFNQLDTFYNSFINDFGRKLESKYIVLIKELYQKIQGGRPQEIPIGFNEYFRKYFHFDHFNNDFYTIIWNIELAKKIIKKSNLQPQKVQVKELMKLVDEEYIDRNKLIQVQKIKKSDPVILVDYNPLNAVLMIDGNHRVYSKRQQPNICLDAYILDDFISMDCMADDVFKCLFALHYNITKLINYSVGNISNDELESMLINMK